MLQKITGKFERTSQMKQFATDAEAMVKKYGWQDRTVMPYGFAMPVTKIIADCKDYPRCTADSQSILIALANGLADILNAWEKDHNAPHLTVRNLKTGKTFSIAADLADIFAKDEFEFIG